MLTKSFKGIGLIELIVGIIIISILAVVTIPAWYGDRNQYFGELDRVSSEILYAQYTAMNRGINTYIVIDDATNTYQVFAREAGGDVLLQDARTINTDIFISTTNNEIEFSGSTGLPLNTYSISFVNGDLFYTIEINSNGELSITDSGGAA